MKKTITCLCLLLLVFGCKKDTVKPPVTPPVVVVPGLPIFKITTSGPVVSKDNYVTGSLNINTNGLFEQETNDITLQIKGRGNSTWDMPKKPYRLKFGAKAKVLGLGAAKNWVLLANYSDKTLMRNYLADNLSQSLNGDFAPHGIFVEVVMNGEYQGTYMLTEQVEVNANRVNITEMKAGDNSGSALTGGYLLELDQRREDPYRFETNGGIPFTIKSPDVPGPAQMDYIKGYVQDTENAIFGVNFADPTNGYARYINSDSFINWFLVNELFKNQDAANFSSMFYYKDRDGKLGMGPTWDFDLGAGNVNYSDATNPTGWWVKNGPWFNRLFQDPAFLTKVRTRWQFLKANGIPQMYKSIDDTQAYLTLPAKENFTKWNILNTYVWPNPAIYGTYPNEVAQLKKWLTQRVAWMDSNL